MPTKNALLTLPKHLAVGFCLTFMLTACGGGGGGDDTAANPPPADDQAMFDALLGPSATEETPRMVDLDGDPSTPDVALDAAAYNPLGKMVSTFQPRHEIFLPGFINSNEPNKTLRIVEHATTDFFDGNGARQLCDLSEPTHTAANGCPQNNILEMDSPIISIQWRTNALTTSVAADLDGNGIDEIVNIYVEDTNGDVMAQIITCLSGCEGNTLPAGDPQGLFTGDGGVYGTQVWTLRPGVGSLPTEGPLYYGNDRATRALDWFRTGIIATDVDGNGRDEIVSVALGQLDVFTFTDGTTSNTFTYDQGTNHSALNLPGTGHMSIASGRFRGRSLGVDQERDDLVIAASEDNLPTKLYFYDDPISSISELNYDPIEEELFDLRFIDTGLRSYRHAFVTAGDIDSDGLDEIVVNAQILSGDYPYAFKAIAFDNWSNGGSAYRHFQGINIHLGEGPMFDQPRSATDFWSPAVKVFWPNGPGTDAVIYAGSSVIKGFAEVVSAQGGSSATAGNSGGIGVNGAGLTNYPIAPAYLARYTNGCRNIIDVFGTPFPACGYNFYFQAPKTVAVADVYGTGQEAILAIWDGNTANVGSETNPTNLMRIVKNDAGTWVWELVATGEYDSNNPNLSQDGLLTAANIDHDSPVVRYIGKSLQFTQPQIIAALAAPPYFSGPNGNSEGTSSTFGTGTGGSTSAEQQVGITSGFSIGYKSPDDALGVPIPSVGWKASFDTAIDSITSQTRDVTTTFSFTSGNQDAVVFSVIPMDVYWYANETSPNEPWLSFNVPRKPIVTSQSVSFYNTNNVANQDIDAAIFTHTTGEPNTYPDVSAKNMLCLEDQTTGCDFDSVNVASVSQAGAGSGGGGGIEINTTNTNGTGLAQNINVNVERSASYGGFEVTSSIGYHMGYSSTISTSETTSFSAFVTGLPDFTNGSYNYGMFVYKDRLPGTNNDFLVLNYWTE